jgi:hypothetical protein
MAAPTSYPSYAYNSTQFASLIVNTAAQFNALGGLGIWTTTPFPGLFPNPADPGETITDAYLRAMLIENRIQNQLLASGFNSPDDPATQLRPDISANDSSANV